MCSSDLAIMFTGLTVATILGVPFGTWLGQQFGWRATFWAVTLVGVGAFAIIALLVPASKSAPEAFNLRKDLAVLKRGPVLAGLLTTVLGWVGVFAVFTYLAPLLTKVTGFSDAAVSPILLVVGVGLLIGNLLGGAFADKRLMPTVLGSLFALSVVLALMTFVPSKYLYPSQPGRLNQISTLLGMVWTVLLTVLIFNLPSGTSPRNDPFVQRSALSSMFYPVFYMVVSWIVTLNHWSRPRQAGEPRPEA